MHKLIKIVTICGIVALAAPAFAQVRFNIRIGPPPPRREVIVVAPFPGALWVPGYYAFDYDINQYRWMPGVWQRPPQPGAVWIAPRYMHRRTRYGFMAGHWQTPGVVGRGAPGRGHDGDGGRWHGDQGHAGDGDRGNGGRGHAGDGGRGHGGSADRNGRAPMGQ